MIFGWARGTFLANICDGFLLVGLGWGGFDQDIGLDIFFCTSFLQVRYFRTLVYRWSNNCESCRHKLLHLTVVQRTGWVIFPNLHHSGFVGQGGQLAQNTEGPDVLDVLLFFCALVTSSWVWHALLLLFCFSSTTGCGSETLASDFSVRMFLLTIVKGATSALEESIREYYPSAQCCAANGLVSKMICIAGGWTKVTFEVSGCKAKLKSNTSKEYGAIRVAQVGARQTAQVTQPIDHTGLTNRFFPCRNKGLGGGGG